ncbi:hypothetical protein B0H15DRAFT_950794 [Mycena belliarum]|uniref:Sacsin/Nov domain-containing protein n=1 Tax=Mycena belliarum TaxID=1033014 RepID=A0AAD6U1D7_9AGAR|nr:hypothetical protein B0H15DRAFT_950794 [Mycena belliae]
MPENFREKADLTKIIKSILDSYPLGNGILRELLQNSDDASATTQTFILDLRTHPSHSIVDEDLVSCQGPALLAINDTLFSDSDWKAISTLHSSSKVNDETKIGKFGIGVRACYHITDNPHFLSGRKLVIFDPHERFSAGQEGGVRIDVLTEGAAYPDQLAAFHGSLSPDSDESFPGTVVRLPLRTPAQATTSRIKPIAVDQSLIKTLFDDFVEKELNVVMLFLKHIRHISLKIIDVNGVETFVGSAEIPDLSLAEKRTFSRNTGAREETFKCAINVTTFGGRTRRPTTVSQVWRVCHAVQSTGETSRIITSNLGYDVGSKLAEDKLFSHVGLAFPIGLRSDFNGRLFTLLPLPIHTGFPVHLHGILALTQDRQSLRNIEETGTGIESRERLVVTWNRAIFDIFLPATWSALLQTLVDQKEVDNIWVAWPAMTHANTNGSSYWRDILSNLVGRVVEMDLPIFPTFPDIQPHVALSSAFIAAETDDIALLRALSSVGLSIVKPPEHIRKVLESSGVVLKFLHPHTAWMALLTRIPALTIVAEDDKDRILQYLVVAPGSISNVIGLPLVPLEGDVFRDCDDDLISLSKLHPQVETIFCSPTAARAVNIIRLDKTKVHLYLHAVFGRFNPADDEVAGDTASSKVEWLARFWKWLSEAPWPDKDGLVTLIARFHLLPTSHGSLRKMESRVLLPVQGTNGGRVMNAWGILGVHFLHPNITQHSSVFQKFAADPGDIPFLVDSISSQSISELDARSASLIQEHLVQSMRARSGKPILDNRQKFAQLPIFPTRTAVRDGKKGRNFSQRGTGPASGTLIFMRVGDECPVPVTPENTTFFDVTPSSSVLGTILDPVGIKKALVEIGVLEMAISHLKVQPLDILDALLSRIIPRISDLSASAKSQLQSVPFVTVSGSAKRIPPTQIVDPRSELALLYEGEVGKLPTGHDC